MVPEGERIKWELVKVDLRATLGGQRRSEGVEGDIKASKGKLKGP